MDSRRRVTVVVPLTAADLVHLGRSLEPRRADLRNAAAARAPSEDELERRFLDQRTAVHLPHVSAIRTLARASLSLALAAADAGDNARARSDVRTTVTLLMNLGAGPTFVEKKAAFQTLASVCTLVRESNNPELTNALTEALAEARLDPADLFELRRSLSTMSRSYTLLLSENPGALDDVVGIELQPGDDIHAVAAEVERVFADIAKVWDRPDAPAEIRRLELTFPYDRFRPFVSGVGRLRREHDEAAEAIRPLLEPPPQ